jgi:hypothetical protein
MSAGDALFVHLFGGLASESQHCALLAGDALWPALARRQSAGRTLVFRRETFAPRRSPGGMPASSVRVNLTKPVTGSATHVCAASVGNLPL